MIKNFFYKLATDQKNGIGASILKMFLWFGSLFYGLGVYLVRGLYKSGLLRSSQLHQKVICVGNVTFGGVGKTPLVIYISNILRQNGFKTAVLTRGYMDGKSEQPSLSDEAEELRMELNDTPVLVGRDRIKQAQEYLEDHSADIFIMDDGFQHWRLARDLDIVVVDATNPFGNNNLLPRGILREPLSALKRANVVVITKVNTDTQNGQKIIDKIRAINPKCLIAEAVHEPARLINLFNYEEEAVSQINGKKVCSFCSIGDPKSFVNTLKSLGVDLRKNFSYIDHHIYSKSDIEKMNQYCVTNSIDTLITTQKDAVKLTELIKDFDRSFKIFKLVIKIRIIKGENDFTNRILQTSEK